VGEPLDRHDRRCHRSYVYDGDGKRVKETVAPTTTVFIGNYCEIAISGTQRLTTTYYYANGQRVAMRIAAGVTYVHSDHLRSTSVTSGAQTGNIKYYPYGATRSGAVSTAYKFTGQRLDDSTGLYYYGARYYDAAIGRFVQADTVVQADAKSAQPVLPLVVSYANPRVLEQWNQLQRARLQPEAQAPGTPSAFDPQFLNRYTYARNNPLAYVDDSGNIAWWIIGGVIGGVAGFGAYALTHRDNFSWGEAALWTAGGAVVGATFGAGAQLVAGALGTQAAATAATAATTASPWALPALQRGQAIHRMLGANLPPNFPGIDRFINGVATSIKTLDLNAATYQNIGALTSKVQGYINALANFQHAQLGQHVIKANQISSRVLELVIPPGATQAQLAALQQLQQYAANLGVTVVYANILNKSGRGAERPLGVNPPSMAGKAG